MGNFINIASESGPVRAYLATPDSGKGPGVLLAHPWWGLNETITNLADRLSAEGYTVLAPDLYDGKVVTTIPDAEKAVGALESDGGSDRAIAKEQAALDYLLNSPDVQGKGIGAIGFSMGAAYVTWLAALRHEIAATVVFYGASEWNADYPKNASAPLMGHWAADDQYESTAEVPVLEAAIKDAGHIADFHTYPNTKHWFFEPDRPEYVPEAAQLAWERTLAFLKSHLA